MLPTLKRITTSLEWGFVVPLLLLGAGDHASMALAQSPGTFTPTGNMTEGRFEHTATLLTNGKVLIAGGYSSTPRIDAFGGALSSAEVYDPSTGRFAAVANMTRHRARHTATLLANGQVLIAGGSAGGSSSSAELYDPSTGTFTPTGNMTSVRLRHTATLLNDGQVLIAGGADAYCCAEYTHASAELYDPSAGTFTATGSMIKRRSGALATLLSSGNVLVDGGADGAELYDPATGSFAPAGARVNPFLFPVTATLLTNGKVLETMTYDDDPSDWAELYDPTTGLFTAAGHMTTAHGGHTATLLPNGTVLIAGVLLTAATELYNPATGAFSPAAKMTTARARHTATLLPDGTVLIAGRPDSPATSAGASAEIYHPAVLIPAPVLLSVSGGGQGAILHAGTPQVASSGSPVTVGEVLEIYCTGLIDGSVIPPQVAIGGRMAEALFFGKVAGFENLNRVNVRMPSGVAPGDAIPVRLTYLGRPSNEVTIGVR